MFQTRGKSQGAPFYNNTRLTRQMCIRRGKMLMITLVNAKEHSLLLKLLWSSMTMNRILIDNFESQNPNRCKRSRKRRQIAGKRTWSRKVLSPSESRLLLMTTTKKLTRKVIRLKMMATSTMTTKFRSTWVKLVKVAMITRLNMTVINTIRNVRPEINSLRDRSYRFSSRSHP